jgi:hypothetical protein
MFIARRPEEWLPLKRSEMFLAGFVTQGRHFTPLEPKNSFGTPIYKHWTPTGTAAGTGLPSVTRTLETGH